MAIQVVDKKEQRQRVEPLSSLLHVDADSRRSRSKLTQQIPQETLQ